jgi:MFS family permease
MWQLTGSYFVCGATTAIISAHYVPFAIERGTSPGVAAMAFGVMSGLNIVGVLAAGMISDRIGRKNTLGTVYAIRCLAYATLLFVPGMFGIWTFALIAGFSWIASAPMTSSLTAEIYGLKNMGTLNGMVTLSHQIGGALSIFMGGVLYDVFDSYTVPFAISGSLLVGASAAAYLIKERKYSSRFRAAQARPAPGVAGDAS